METTVSSQAKKTKKRVACIGRWMPIHNGHKKFLIELAKSDNYDKVIIMIGSCYEKVCKKYGATHFCTGNKEDILNVLEAREEKLDMRLLRQAKTEESILLKDVETGLKIKMIDNSLEPAIVKFENVSNTSLEQMCWIIKNRLILSMV